jgi:hypothetical protein
VGGQVIIVLEAFVEHCLLLLLGHFWQFSSLDLSQTNVFHHASSPGGGTRRKLACSIGSPYSRQALGKSTVEPIFIFNSAGRPVLSHTRGNLGTDKRFPPRREPAGYRKRPLFAV